MTKLLWNQTEAAENLGLGRSTVQSMTASGELPSIKIGSRRMYPVEELAAWVNDQLAVVTPHEA